MSAPRFCLWGGRRGSVQIGSAEDRRLQAFSRLTADVQRIGVALGDALREPMRQMRQATEAVAAFGQLLSGETR